VHDLNASQQQQVAPKQYKPGAYLKTSNHCQDAFSETTQLSLMMMMMMMMMMMKTMMIGLNID
jgi:hypothetical protein